MAAALAAASPTAVLAGAPPGHEHPGNANGLHKPLADAAAAPAVPPHTGAAITVQSEALPAAPPQPAPSLTTRGAAAREGAAVVALPPPSRGKKAEALTSGDAPRGLHHGRGDRAPAGATATPTSVVIEAAALAASTPPKTGLPPLAPSASGSAGEPAGGAAPPPLIAAPPEGPHPPPVASPQFLTAARVNLILSGVVVALAAAVIAAVRIATRRGRRQS